MPSVPNAQQFFCEHALLPHGWGHDVLIEVDLRGNIARIDENASAGQAELLGEYVIPGMTNAHSHAFQRAMAGLAEFDRTGEDNFWSWRETMYRFAEKMDPEQNRAVAAQLYLEMLKAGYTHVCEFHYLHHGREGAQYAPPDLMADGLMDAAEQTGIGLTMLPALYMQGGIDRRPLTSRQKRFGNSLEEFSIVAESIRRKARTRCNFGIAIHSLRAVDMVDIGALLASGLTDHGPIHIHIAEQQKEVEDCLTHLKKRPVAWLLEHVALSERWCLVHATHMDHQETASLAKTGAVVALCPSTEGNLGDGFFPLNDFLSLGGKFAIGSDSHISISPVEELRWMEYVQRLLAKQRNIATWPDKPHTGENLWRHAAANGTPITGLRIGQIGPGFQADFLVLDGQSPLLTASRAEQILDQFVFNGNTNAIRDVFVKGKRVIAAQKHAHQESIVHEFKRVMTTLRKN